MHAHRAHPTTLSWDHSSDFIFDLPSCDASQHIIVIVFIGPVHSLTHATLLYLECLAYVPNIIRSNRVRSLPVSFRLHSTHTLAVTQNAIQFVFGNRISVNIIFGQTKFYNGIRVQNHQAFTFARHQALISLSRTHICIYTRNGHQTHSRWEHITTCRISVRNKRGKRTVEVKPKSFEAQSELVAGQTKINF